VEKGLVGLIGLFCALFPSTRADDARADVPQVSDELVAQCTTVAGEIMRAVDLVYGSSGGSATTGVQYTGARPGPYTTELHFRAASSIVDAWEMTLFQDEDGEGCYLASLDWVGDL
jgi:hypothetical protein